MNEGALGKEYQHGEVIIRQGEIGDCMYVIQAGTVEVFIEEEGQEIHLADRSAGDFFGEMALFDHEVRSATVRTKGPVRVLTVDRQNLLRHIQENPSMAFRILEKLSSRIRELLVKVNHTHNGEVDQGTV
jgi:CRP-like cAMP-binding protein